MSATNGHSLTCKEAAARARLNAEVFRRMIREGRGPKDNGVLKGSKLRRFLDCDIDAWVAAGFKNDPS